MDRAAAPPLGVGADQLADVVARLRRALRRGVRTDHPTESLPMAQIELLQQVAGEPGARINDLAADLRLAPNTVSTLVARLCADGLLIRTGDSDDRRSRRLSVSADGHAALAAWQQTHQRMLAVALERIGPDDRTAVLTALPALENLTRALANDN